MRSQVKDVGQETLVVWGRNDEILPPDNARRFMEVRCGVEAAISLSAAAVHVLLASRVVFNNSCMPYIYHQMIDIWHAV